MLDALTADKPDAMILDFFAGSATTLHAVCLLNASDGVRRRTVLVTNNELSERDDRDARKSGYLPGDAEYESRGVFEAVTRPRIEAALSGRRPGGEPATGFRYPPYTASTSRPQMASRMSVLSSSGSNTWIPRRPTQSSMAASPHCSG